MLYILKHFDININQCWKWNPCQNDESKSVYGGTKSHVSVSDEIVQADQDRVFFLAFLFIFITKISLFTSDIHFLWNGIEFESVILFKFIHFYKKFVAKKI